ncbi:hypothetical protein [Nocardiopsis sp. LOL_012]|uniref:hypothetical protein n=1 Tax=Nocardiopsis sp. LOL_012 TaxID=3345409 RepID=UPI003A848975
MAPDITMFLSSASRLSVRSAAAEVFRSGPGGAEHEASVCRLHADDWLHWDYTVRDERGETRHTCDGTVISSTGPGRGERRHSPVPASPTRDDPLYFYSWMAFAQGWFVEMLRPLDLLARVRVTSIGDPDDEGRARITAEPMGSEPSPYGGFALPDGRGLELGLDTRLGCLTEARVTRRAPTTGEGTFYRITHLEP